MRKFKPCAMPGCNELVEQRTDGRPRRRYCSAAHRQAARQLRQGRPVQIAGPAEDAKATATEPAEDAEPATTAEPDEPPASKSGGSASLLLSARPGWWWLAHAQRVLRTNASGLPLPVPWVVPMSRVQDA